MRRSTNSCILTATRTLPDHPSAQPADHHGLSPPPLHPSGAPALQLRQGRTELDFGGRPGQLDALKQSLLAVLRQELFAAGSAGEQLWEQGQDDAKRRAQRCITAVQEASRLAAGRGWIA